MPPGSSRSGSLTSPIDGLLVPAARSRPIADLPNLTWTMKPRGGAVPEPGGGTRAARTVTRELASAEDVALGEDIELDPFDEDTDGRPEPLIGPMETAEIDASRDRRVTIASPIPARLAEAMLARGFGRDPAAPTPSGGSPAQPWGEPDEHHTRRVGDSDRQPLGSTSRPNAAQEAGVALFRQRAAALIDGARRALDEGDLTAAVTAAEGALQESDGAPPPGIVEVIEPARPLLARVFGAYVGSLGGVPVLAPRAEEIARARLGELERALVARIDGQRTLEALFDGSGLGSTDALRIAARLLRAGAIRVI